MLIHSTDPIIYLILFRVQNHISIRIACSRVFMLGLCFEREKKDNKPLAIVTEQWFVRK
jgi:hypothetical protein